ncbi:MAG: dihydroorotate dehydrogenase (quinone) [Legionellales bacterium RIFCSPHIGHO2_12_FULL_42_9]|nr:MAG: dihydroorotate dehydrogenase (quinone) [Legionellales bacterium RIFCSPHIGHO2_12_FULL_42_9]
MTQLQWYDWLRPILFKLSPECAHELVLKALNYAPRCCFKTEPSLPVDAMGIRFPNRVGLAAGFDNNAAHLDSLSKLGFGFIEVGGVTPKAQPGNPTPRLFRLAEAKALINRMGFKNGGVDALVENIRVAHYKGILGVNISKSQDTSLDNAAVDYTYCMQAIYPHASYIAVNVSSPNTPNLRQLQYGEYFAKLMVSLTEEQKRLSDTHQRHVPLVVKLSPDESDDALKRMAAVLLQHQVAGIIATNTTCRRDGVQGLKNALEAGGLSGSPLRVHALTCLRLLKQEVGDAMTLIASGGIDSAEAAEERLQAGATLLQVYTGLIYKGPRLINDILCALTK